SKSPRAARSISKADSPRSNRAPTIRQPQPARAACEHCRGWQTAGAHRRSLGTAGAATARDSHLQAMWSFVTDFGDTAVTVPLAVLMGCFLLAARQPRLAVGWALTIIGCAGAVGGLKLVLAACGYALGGPHQASPSGHTAMSVAVYGGYAAVTAANLARPARELVVAGTAMLVIGIALSRVIAGGHSPIEVWIGLAVGVAAL